MARYLCGACGESIEGAEEDMVRHWERYHHVADVWTMRPYPDYVLTCIAVLARS